MDPGEFRTLSRDAPVGVEHPPFVAALAAHHHRVHGTFVDILPVEQHLALRPPAEPQVGLVGALLLVLALGLILAWLAARTRGPDRAVWTALLVTTAVLGSALLLFIRIAGALDS